MDRTQLLTEYADQVSAIADTPWEHEYVTTLNRVGEETRDMTASETVAWIGSEALTAEAGTPERSALRKAVDLIREGLT